MSGQLVPHTWQGCVGLASLGTDAVVPACVWVLNKASQVAEELSEGRVPGLIDGIIEQRGAPQSGVLPKQNAVDAGQALLCWVQRLQVVLPPPRVVAPWLLAVVEASEVMSA